MREPNSNQTLVESPAFAAMQRLLHQEAVEQELSGTMEVAVARRVAVLERQAPEIVQAAHAAEVEIEYLGVGPLADKPRYYKAADGSDWVLGPARDKSDAVMPRREAEKIERLEAVGLYLPQVYVAHQVRPEVAAAIGSQLATGSEIAPDRAAELVGPIPPPAESVALGEQMADYSRQIAAALRRAEKMVVGAVTIPVAAAGAVLAHVTIDPIVIGAIPAVSEKPGSPAAFYLLARWDW